MTNIPYLILDSARVEVGSYILIGDTYKKRNGIDKMELDTFFCKEN